MRPKWQVIAGISVLVIILGVLVGVGFSMFYRGAKPAPKKTEAARPKKKTPKPPAPVACPFRGEAGEEQVSRPLAVMIENLNSVRPQAGIGSACVVVEGLAEGGITRLMLVFGNHAADDVGPVRSARTHFVALARGWDAIYAHVGGSKYAMQAIKDWGLADWDQIGHGASFTRVGWTRAPHNVFTSTSRLRNDAAALKDGAGDMSARGLKFKAAPPLESRPDGLKKVTIDFSYPEYRVEYQYDRQTNTYKRFNGGRPHTDANTKLQVAPANVAIMRANTSSIPGGSGVLDVQMTGSGPLTVLRDGQVIEGTWEKPTYDSPLTFMDAQGNEIEFSPGQTWIEIVQPTTAITIQQ